MQSEINRQRYGVALYAFATITASAILSLHFFLQPLRPWTDQGWMLQAAVRHANGEELTSQLTGGSLDITRPAFARLTYFPPGYPLLVSAMLRGGLEVTTAVKIVNAAALVIGVIGWLFLALPLLEGPALRIIYCALLVLACGAVLPKGGTADFLFWAGVPWWVSYLARARIEEGRSRIGLLSLVALVTSVLISVRWAAVFLVPVAILALMIPLKREARELMRNTVAAMVVALPPTLIYLAIGAINRHYSSGANLLAFMNPGWRPRYLLTLYPFQSLFAIPLGLEPLVDRVWRSIDPAMGALWGIAIFRVALPLILVVAIFASVQRARLIGSLPRTFASVLFVIILVGAGLVAFLTWMALRYNWDFVDWSFLSDARYYRPFLPAFLLGWLMLLDRLQSKRLMWRAGVALLAISSFYLFQAAARAEWSILRTHDESLELVEKVRSLTTNPGLNVVFDIDISDYIIHPEPNLIASGYLAETELPTCYAGQPATLWFVRRVHETSAYLLDRDRDPRRFEAHRQRFGPTLAWTSSEGNYEIHMATVR
jgi:hypothetical protein